MVVVMSTETRTAKDIFVELVNNVPPKEWDERLEQACQGNNELQSRVRALLHAHASPGSFLEQPAVAAGATILHESPICERPGTVIGPYKLLQQIGEGGMGVVFMAEQTEPIQRTVALKIIKPGMDTRQVIARFEAERQAVAMMDHPNIAKVLDAGTTESERPYFVMELVKGVPITKYCDEKHLPIRARLELFVQVCQAVQHAHQKGIIHRDIKPNNVLVAEYDNTPFPK
jgi:serine/threonine protein kinase